MLLDSKFAIFLFYFNQEISNVDPTDRDKRKIFGPDVGFGVKNAVLGYVFGVSWKCRSRTLIYLFVPVITNNTRSIPSIILIAHNASIAITFLYSTYIQRHLYIEFHQYHKPFIRKRRKHSSHKKAIFELYEGKSEKYHGLKFQNVGK